MANEPPAPGNPEGPESLSDPHLRIASYNIHRGVGTDLSTDIGRIARVIDELGCDTIGLQEVDNTPGLRSDSMQLEYLANVLGMEGVPGKTIIRHEGHYGNALLTRRKIHTVRLHDLSFGGYEPRNAIDAEIDVAGQTVRVIVTHLGLMPGERRFQVRKLLDLIRHGPLEQPVVVLGDINEWLPLGRPLRWLHGLLGKPPWERSFPTAFPLFALDRVWARPHRTLLSFSVHRSALARRASDHYPVKAVIAPERHLNPQHA